MNRVISIIDLVAIVNELSNQIADIKGSITKLHGDSQNMIRDEVWEENIKKDKRVAVQILYSKLKELRAKKTRMEINYVCLLTNEDVELSLKDKRNNLLLEDIHCTFSFDE